MANREQEIEALAREIASDHGFPLPEARRYARRLAGELRQVARRYDADALADYAAGWDAESAARRQARG